ncbi:F-box protein CPR30 [Prunus yedoensis var. nudiflora]|uniref:F-box protein CPR30 n=1 Tax=Prunus yedoensis var. nudiflora TaxID=2094558 RepID=A0A314ZIM6_PRUYE|nr:F-box protein CPR30 [Prunus yedoensis var. nudiflora]
MVLGLDVDSGGIRAVQVGSSSMSDCVDLMPVDVFSYSGGYISLRKYGDLMEAETGERNFFSVGKMMQRSMLPRYCFEVGVEEGG